MHDGEPDFEDAIRQARTRLNAFERSGSAKELVTRLRAYSPLHPFLLMRGLSLFATLLFLALTLTALIAPLADARIAEVVGRLDSTTGVPMFAMLAVLVVCFFIVAFGAHYAAISVARGAPMLPHEARIHQRLVSDLQQLEAQQAVSSRLTPRPPSPRTARPVPVRPR